MEVHIEEYRGWEIKFDTTKETFYCHSDRHDLEETKKSYASIKKFIDEFIKENEKFVPFYVEGTPNSYYDIRGKRIKIVGIRRDGRFYFENQRGEKEQLSEYNEKDYILYDPKNTPLWAELQKLKDEREMLNNKISAAEKLITGKSLVDYKKELLNEK